jgi:cysteine desulfurase
MSSYYLDHAAATPLDPVALDAMMPYLIGNFENPSSITLASRAIRADIESARSRVARILGCPPTSVIFTAGCTEANNLAIKGFMERYPGSNVVYSAVEHPAVVEPANSYPHSVADVLHSGMIDIADLTQKIDDETVLVSVMLVNNEIGTIQPIEQISEIVSQIRNTRKNSGNDRPLYLHTDAAQASNYLGLDVTRLGVDMMSINGSKTYGPKQSGCLYLRSGLELLPQINGGGQEKGRRSGTENVAYIVGFSVALERAQTMRGEETKRLIAIRDYTIDKMSQIFGERMQLNGTRLNRIANNISVAIDGIDNERVVMELDQRGFQIAVGSACKASNDQPSQVLSAIGLSESQISNTIRISLGRSSDISVIDRFLAQLSDLLMQP